MKPFPGKEMVVSTVNECGWSNSGSPWNLHAQEKGLCAEALIIWGKLCTVSRSETRFRSCEMSYAIASVVESAIKTNNLSSTTNIISAVVCKYWEPMLMKNEKNGKNRSKFSMVLTFTSVYFSLLFFCHLFLISHVISIFFILIDTNSVSNIFLENIHRDFVSLRIAMFSFWCQLIIYLVA